MEKRHSIRKSHLVTLFLMILFSILAIVLQTNLLHTVSRASSALSSKSALAPSNVFAVLFLTSYDAANQNHQLTAIYTSQDLPRRNNSRNLCGVVPNASAKAIRFPSIISSVPSKQSSQCRSNVILYMVQKGKHSSYDRDSTAFFLKSLDLLYKNYLAIDQHYKNVDVLIFHSGDYLDEDLEFLDDRYNHTVFFKLVDLNQTDYWVLPDEVRYDNMSQWAAFPTFSVGYRHMMRWYALKLYDFIRDFSQDGGRSGCPQYKYIMRMDEDSFIHSPIRYDLFDFMDSHNYSYAFRMCAFEMNMTLWDDYVDHRDYCGIALPNGVPYRPLLHGLCGFYNNFFIVETAFTLRPDVQHFLQWTDTTGTIYRERSNDLQIQTIAVYAFLPTERIHRFLDWTYEHMTMGPRCPSCGAIQAGYLDPDPEPAFALYNRPTGRRRRCYNRDKYLDYQQTSPTYSHLPPSSWFEKTLGHTLAQHRFRTHAAGFVEFMRDGHDSG